MQNLVLISLAGLAVACSPPVDSTAGPSEAVASAEAVAGTASPPPGNSVEFQAGLGFDGYYVPHSELVFGDWTLLHVYIGRDMDWPAPTDGGRLAAEAPVWVEFADPSGGTIMTELGESPAVVERVRATRLVLTEGEFTFEGRSDEVGDVLVSGQIEPDAIGTREGIAFRGGMEVDGERIRNLSMRHWHGD
ncbi:hypothetical protein [Maricaulis sp. CAU 1757]